MKQKIGLVMIFCLLLSPVLVGCTAPTQVIAENALQRAKDVDQKVINDLALRAKQSALDIMRTKVHSSITAQDKEAADTAMLAFMDEIDKIHFMLITHERALRLMAVAERFIWEQKGILNILIEEWGEAKKIVNEREPEVGETGPVSKWNAVTAAPVTSDLLSDFAKKVQPLDPNKEYRVVVAKGPPSEVRITEMVFMGEQLVTSN